MERKKTPVVSLKTMQLPLKRFTFKGKKVIFLLTQQIGSDDIKVDDEALI